METFSAGFRRVWLGLHWLSFLLLLAARGATHTAEESSCGFRESLVGQHCFGMQQAVAETATRCLSVCCNVESCAMWLFSAEHGCWTGNHTGHKCVDSTKDWVGASGKYFAAAGRASALAAWRSGRMAREPGRASGAVQTPSCCPGRWCCRNGTKCCPPRRVAPIFEEPTTPQRYFEHPANTLLVDDVMSGGYQLCHSLTVAIGDRSFFMEAGTDPLSNAEELCKARTGGHGTTITEDEEECVRETISAIASGISNTSAKALANRVHDAIADGPCQIWRWDRDRSAYTPLNGAALRGNFAASWREFDASTMPLPPRAFRWLKEAEHGEGAHRRGGLIPRHAHGQALVSDTFRLIFLHVPKAGSTTVRKLLWQYDGRDMLGWDTIPQYKRDTYLTFAAVRDPVRRFVSAYDEVCLKLGPSCAFFDSTSDDGLWRFLNYTLQHPCWDEHVCDQVTFLRDRGGRPARIDLLAETSTLNQALLTLSSLLDLQPPITPALLHAANPSSPSSRKERPVLQDASFVRTICQLYAIDYRLLGFPLPSPCLDDETSPSFTTTQPRDSDNQSTAQEPSTALYPDDWVDDQGLVSPSWRPNISLDAFQIYLAQKIGAASVTALASGFVVGTSESRRLRALVDKRRCLEKELKCDKWADCVLEASANSIRDVSSAVLRATETRSGLLDNDHVVGDTGGLPILQAVLRGNGADHAAQHKGHPGNDNTHADEIRLLGKERKGPKESRAEGKQGAVRGKDVTAVQSVIESAGMEGMWWRAAIVDWLWRPLPELLSLGMETLARGAGVSPIVGPYVALVVQQCADSGQSAAGFNQGTSKWTEARCTEREGMDGDGWPRMEQERAGGCFGSVQEAWCAMVRAERQCSACSTVAHYRLEHFMDKAMQARRSGVEGGQLDSVVIITDDHSVAEAANSPAWQSTYSSWTIAVVDMSHTALAAHLAPGDRRQRETTAALCGNTDSSACALAAALVAAVEVARKSQHLVGSVHSSFFNLCSELHIAWGHRSAAASGEVESWDRTGGLRRLWAVEVPLGAGGGGFLGANVAAAVVEQRQGKGGEFGAGWWQRSRDQGEDEDREMRGGSERAFRLRESECDGDWLSVQQDGDCAVEVSKVNEYLPSVSVLAAAKQRARLVDGATDHLLQSLALLQHDIRSCSRARPALFPNHGAAATMNYLVIQLKRGLRDNRPVFFRGRWIYGGCEKHDFSCVFEPESVCNDSHVPSQTGSETAPEHSVGYGEEEWGGPRSEYPYRSEEVDPWYVPPVYRVEGKGVLWYNGVVTGFLFKPIQALRDLVQTTLLSLDILGTPFIGVQVRRGDACGQTRPCLDMDLYVESVLEMVDKYGYQAVYIASDDEEAVREFRARVEHRGVRVAAQALDRGFTAANTDKCATLANAGIRTLNFDPRAGCEWIEDKLKRASVHDKAAQATGVLVDIELLAAADAFVGTFTSALSRVAFQLSLARKGYVKPFRSLDLAWCWAGFHQIPSPWGTYGC